MATRTSSLRQSWYKVNKESRFFVSKNIVRREFLTLRFFRFDLYGTTKLRSASGRASCSWPTNVCVSGFWNANSITWIQKIGWSGRQVLRQFLWSTTQHHNTLYTVGYGCYIERKAYSEILLWSYSNGPFLQLKVVFIVWWEQFF